MPESLPPLAPGIPAIELVDKADNTLKAYACSKCGVVHSITNKYLAEVCCEPKLCSYENCEELREAHRSVCTQHFAKSAAEREGRKFAEATKVNYVEWAGEYLYSDRLDQYFEGWSEYLDAIADADYEAEPYLWDCFTMGMSIDSADVVDNALSDHHEDAAYDVTDEEGLQVLLDEWCAKQTVKTIMPSTNTAVLAPTAKEKTNE